MIYFWCRREWDKLAYTLAITYGISYGGRVIYALIYEKKTGKTPVDE